MRSPGYTGDWGGGKGERTRDKKMWGWDGWLGEGWSGRAMKDILIGVFFKKNISFCSWMFYKR